MYMHVYVCTVLDHRMCSACTGVASLAINNNDVMINHVAKLG